VISLSPGPFRFAYNEWLQDWELWALGGLIDDLVVQNYAYSITGFAKDLDQPALVKARTWGIPVEIGILAGFGTRTTSMDNLSQKVQLAAQRGHGVIYFYWEGLWGTYAGKEGGPYRRATFAQLHRAVFEGSRGGSPTPPFRPAPPAFLVPPPLPAASNVNRQPLRTPGPLMQRPLPPPPPPLP